MDKLKLLTFEKVGGKDSFLLNEQMIAAVDELLKTTSGIVNLHPTKGTHWVMFANEFYFDSYGCPPPLNITKQIKNGFHSEYQIQKKESFCAAYCLYVLYLTNILGFKNAVLNLY